MLLTYVLQGLHELEREKNSAKTNPSGCVHIYLLLLNNYSHRHSRHYLTATISLLECLRLIFIFGLQAEVQHLEVLRRFLPFYKPLEV